MSFNMCVFMPFLLFSHPEESLFTRSFSANGNGHHGDGGISHCGLLATDNESLPAGCNCIFITLKLSPVFRVNSCLTVSLSLFFSDRYVFLIILKKEKVTVRVFLNFSFNICSDEITQDVNYVYYHLLFNCQ